RPSTGTPSSAHDDASRHEAKVGSQDVNAAGALHLDSEMRPSTGAPSSARDDASRHETKVGSQDVNAAGAPHLDSEMWASQDATTLTAAGPYTLQAAIAACHARALTPEATDWRRIAALYAQLLQITPSPIIELNRAVAVS